MILQDRRRTVAHVGRTTGQLADGLALGVDARTVTDCAVVAAPLAPVAGVLGDGLLS